MKDWQFWFLLAVLMLLRADLAWFRNPITGAEHEKKESAASSSFWLMIFFAILSIIALSVSFANAAALPAPDDVSTPGDVRTGELHAPRPATPAAIVREVERRYAVSGVHDPSCGAGRCEIDHRIPYGCLGASTAANLSFQTYGAWQRKDRLEHWAERQVALGRLTVGDCQEMFRAPNDWRARYEVVFGEKP